MTLAGRLRRIRRTIRLWFAPDPGARRYERLWRRNRAKLERWQRARGVGR